MGAYLAAAVPNLPFDCGLATVSLFVHDIAQEPLVPVAGAIPVRRVTPDAALLDRFAADAERTQWWHERIARCYRLLAD
jgi:O-succinylbenzoate synthase